MPRASGFLEVASLEWRYSVVATSSRRAGSGRVRAARYLVCTAGLLTLSAVALVLAQVLPVSAGPPSRLASSLLAISDLAALAHIALSVGVAAVSLIALAIALKRRSIAARALALALALACASVAVVPASWQISWWARRAGVRNIAEHAAPIVIGVTRFAQEQGHPPFALDELIPDYLDQIPNTGLRGCPDFAYKMLEDVVPHGVEAGGWELRVLCPTGMLNWDTYLFWPSGAYPLQTHGGSAERIGSWAYVHE